MDLGTFFSTTISFGYIFLLYVLPWLLILLVYAWLKDWVVDIYRRLKKKTENVIEDAKKERWLLVLHLMKIFMFVLLLVPILAVITYLLDDTTPDPGQILFSETMFYVFIAITAWFFLAIIVQTVYVRNRTDLEEEAEERGG